MVTLLLLEPKQKQHFTSLGKPDKKLSFIFSKLWNLIVLGDFNACIDESCMGDFCGTYDFWSLIRKSKCNKTLENSTCIDLLLTNHPRSVRDSYSFEKGLSDFHKMSNCKGSIFFEALTKNHEL